MDQVDDIIQNGMVVRQLPGCQVLNKTTYSDAFKQDVLRGWVTYGDGLRDDINNDRGLLDYSPEQIAALEREAAIRCGDEAA